jgi:hypothetical protein
MVNAFSFCLYGPPKALYYQGLIENIEIIRQYFPDWITYVYLGSDVPRTFEDTLHKYKSIRIRKTGVSDFSNRLFRFFAIDEDDVEVMMVRDSDSRIHERDRWAIRDFLNSPEYSVHAIRDHPLHFLPMLAGLWGIRKTVGVVMRKEYEDYLKKHITCDYGEDQCFLTEQIYNPHFSKLLVHVPSMNITFMNESVRIIPLRRSDSLFCGKVEHVPNINFDNTRIIPFIRRYQPRPTK